MGQGGVGGLNLFRLCPVNRVGPHAGIFFLSAFSCQKVGKKMARNWPRIAGKPPFSDLFSGVKKSIPRKIIGAAGAVAEVPRQPIRGAKLSIADV
jgi:hypothetical protein